MTVNRKRKKQIISHIAVYLCAAFAICLCLSACGKKEDKPAALLDDGVYSVDFQTDSSMFHVNEACDGKGTLTVEDGKMMLHISLPSKNVVNLYPGLAEDAKVDGTELLMPTTDTVTYSDGMTEEVNGFDVPVSVLDEEFDLALLGTKGIWYDHKVSISNPVPADNSTKVEDKITRQTPSELEDGEYTVEVSLEGGSGRAGVTSPAVLIVKNRSAVVRIEWSSPYYDYMVVGDETFEPANAGGNSVFEFPLESFDEPISVIADTTAMSRPHEVEYTLTFYGNSLSKE